MMSTLLGGMSDGSDSTGAREHEGEPQVGDVLGRYTVLGRLGRGGMGTVFKAYDEALDRAIALKLLHSGVAQQHAQRLTREAQALAKLSHPHVVHVYEVGQAQDQWFIAMELVHGHTVRQWQDRAPPWRECVEVYLQAGRTGGGPCSGVGAPGFQAGELHRR